MPQQTMFLNILTEKKVIRLNRKKCTNLIIFIAQIKDHYELLIQHPNQLLDYQQKHHVYQEFLL